MSRVAAISIDGVSLDVEYTYYPYYAGDRGSLGEPLSPPEPATVEIKAVTSTENIMDLLSRGMLEKIDEAVMREISEGREE